MYFRCCPSCNAWASNHIGVGCLPTTRDQESEIQKIISYSYEDITSHSIDEINPEKEETICNLCEELHKKRKPIDAFTEVLEIESTTEAIQDYETLFATLPHSTTIMNKLGREIMEIETSTQKIEDVSSIQDLKNEIVIKDENTKIDKESLPPIGENNEDIINYDETSIEVMKRSNSPTRKKFKKKMKKKKEEEIMSYGKSSSELIENGDTVPKEKKLENSKQDVEITENIESSLDTIENKKDRNDIVATSYNLKPKIRKKLSKEDRQENESVKHDKEKMEEAELKKEESSGSGDESSSGSGGSDNEDIYNGYGNNFATLKMGK